MQRAVFRTLPNIYDPKVADGSKSLFLQKQKLHHRCLIRVFNTPLLYEIPGRRHEGKLRFSYLRYQGKK